MNREQAIQEIKSRINCADYLTRSKGGLYCCPFCGSGTGNNGTGALKVYETNTFTCHACNQSGDVIDLYMKTNGTDFNQSILLLADKLGITIDQDKQRPDLYRTEQARNKLNGSEQDPACADYSEYYKICQGRIKDPAAADYLKKRGISIDTAAAYGIGYDPAADPGSAPGAIGNEYKPHPCPRIIIPTSKNHYVGRRIDGEKTYQKMNPKNSTPAIFNEKILDEPDPGLVFVVEGAFDALSILEMGCQAIALNSAGNAELLLKKIEKDGTKATFILCPDNDQDPRTADNIRKEFATLAAGLERLKVLSLTADINGRYKDANEHLQRDWESFIEALEQAQNNARIKIRQLREAAQQTEIERQQRTGAGMIDSFLAAVKTKKYEPIPTGIKDIDKALGGGFMRQWLILLGAPPGSGKTAFTQWIFENMAKQGYNSLYLNLEMSRDQLLARSIARIVAAINWGSEHPITPVQILQGYKWDLAQESEILKAAEKYKVEIAPHIIYNPEGITSDLDGIMKYAEEEAERAEAAGMNAPFLIVDYLQVISGGQREDKIDLIQRAIKSLKDYAIRHNTIVFSIIAQNRESNRTGISSMESGRDTSNIEYGADLLLGLDFTRCLKRDAGKSRDELTAEDLKYKTLKIHKVRFGEAGADTDLFFDGKTMSFLEIDKTHDERPPAKRTVIRI